MTAHELSPDNDTDGADGGDALDLPRSRRWDPEANEAAAGALRILMLRPWLVAGRDDETIAALRRNLRYVEAALTRLGWLLIVERDFVRLRKSPPSRREAWSADGPTPLQASWFFLLVAGAETLAPRVGLGQLITATRAAAAEAAVPTTNDIDERRAIAKALRFLVARGVIEEVDGNVDEFIDDPNAVAVLAIHHTRLAHVIANYGEKSDPAEDPAAWLAEVEREPDVARRMRRRLVDDAAVYAIDLNEAEAEWLSRRVRADDGLPLAKAFGLRLERRAEGAAFIVPEDAFRYQHELGLTFPGSGTLAHASLLACDFAARTGTETIDGIAGPGPGWRGINEAVLVAHLAEVGPGYAASRTWKADLAAAPATLAEKILVTLRALDLVRVSAGVWWFSPVTGRWPPPSSKVAGAAEAKT